MYNPTCFNIDTIICENMLHMGFPTLFACIQVTGCVIYCVYLCVCERERGRERGGVRICVCTVVEAYCDIAGPLREQCIVREYINL